MEFIKNVIRGITIGIANVVPGVSGGTIMVSLGIYDELLQAVTGFFRHKKESILKLFPYLFGMGIGIICLSFMIGYLFENFPFQTAMLFIGLIFGGVPLIWRKVSRGYPKVPELALFLGFFCLMIGMQFLGKGSEQVLAAGPGTAVKLFAVGLAAAATMVIPGVSGSMLLMALGYYTPVIDHINAFVVAVVMLDAGTAWYCLVLLVPFGCGVLGGIFLVAKLMEYLLCRFERLTYWAIFGLLAASPVAILGKIPLRGTYMQDKDSEALRNQRRRRKRIARMKHTIIAIIAGWIILSMILIIFLLVRTRSMERKLDELWQMQRVMNQQVPDTEALPQEETSGMDTETVAVTAPASGIDETDNLAQDGDVHKVYLTFDDGPSENTDAILDVLSEYDVKATFFVVGKEDEASAAIYQRIVDEGHTLGMHSYSNKYSLIYQSEDAFEADFHQLQDYLYEVTGEKSRYYRFPGGSSNQISNVPMSSLIRFLNSEDVVYYDWNVSAGDAANAAYTPEELVENVVSDVSKYKTSVVLLHDSEDRSTTVEAVGPLIEALQDMDAEILPIDEDTQVIQYVKADSAR